MKILLSLLVVQAGLLAFGQSQIQFSKTRCQQAMPAGFSALCDLHEEQFKARSFRLDAIVGYTYTTCNKYTGELSRHSSGAVPCVSYLVESELKKEIAVTSVFGLTPKYPLNYKGLLINFSLYQPQVQYGHGTATHTQMGGGYKSRQMGDSGSSGSQQMQ